jgi:hypothetical protein
MNIVYFSLFFKHKCFRLTEEAKQKKKRPNCYITCIQPDADKCKKYNKKKRRIE